MKKYIPYIVIYLIYASIVLISISDERGSHYTQAFLGWIVTIPLLVGSILYIVISFQKSPKKERGRVIPSIFSPQPSSKEETSVFIEDYSLLDFAKKFGPKMQIGTLKDAEGKTFKKIRFINNEGKETFASFFSQLGYLTSSEIVQRKYELKIGKMTNGKYYLHDSKVEPWQDVDLTL